MSFIDIGNAGGGLQVGDGKFRDYEKSIGNVNFSKCLLDTHIWKSG